MQTSLGNFVLLLGQAFCSHRPSANRTLTTAITWQSTTAEMGTGQLSLLSCNDLGKWNAHGGVLHYTSPGLYQLGNLIDLTYNCM